MEFQNILGEKSRVAVAKMWPCEVCVPLASLREPLGSWQSLPLYVNLSATKDLLADYTLSTRVVAGRL